MDIFRTGGKNHGSIAEIEFHHITNLDFFTEPAADTSLITNNKQLKKLTNAELSQLLSAAADALDATDENAWNADTLQAVLNQLLEKTGQKPGVLFSLIRIVTTWAPFSPALNETLALIGKDQTLHRIDQAIAMSTSS